jgi:hypothetical protein
VCVCVCGPVEPAVREIRSHLVQRSDFQTIKVIGRGAFGEVRPVRTPPRTARGSVYVPAYAPVYM